MTMNNDDLIEEVQNSDYSFEMSTYISEGWDLTKKYMGELVGYTVVFFIIAIVASLMFSFVPFAGNVASSILTTILTVGFYIVGYKIWKGQPFEFSNFFDGFKEFQQLALLSVVQQIAIILCFVPLIIAGAGTFISTGIFEGMPLDPEDLPDFSGLMTPFILSSLLLGMVVAVFLSTVWAFAPMFVALKKMQFWDAMEASRKIIQKRLFNFIGLYIVLFIINMGGVLLLCIGLLFTIPLTMMTLYKAFEHIVLKQDSHEGEADDLQDHLIA